MKGILKWPLMITAVVVVVRVVLERSGASNAVTNILSVAVLTVLICPLYFSVRIARAGVASPYLTLIKTTALFAVLARAMVIPTYWLGYVYGWTQPRFGQLVGANVTPLAGYLTIPFLTGFEWIVVSVVIGGALGSLMLAVMRRLRSTPPGIPSPP